MDPTFNLLSSVNAAAPWLAVAAVSCVAFFAHRLLRERRQHIEVRDELANTNDLVEHLSEGVYRSTPGGHQISANKALVRLNGYSSEAEMLGCVTDIGKEWYVKPGRRDEFRAILRRDGKVENFVSEIFRHKTGERIWVTESARLVFDKRNGKPLYYEGSIREITETVKRLELEERIQKLTGELPGALFQFITRSGGSAEVPYVSAAFSRITGIGIEEFIATPTLLAEMVIDEDRQDFRASLWAAAENRRSWDHEFRIVARDGVEKWVRVTATPEFHEGEITWHGYFNDISVRKRHEMEIEELAYFDPLCKLPNRRLLLNRLAEAVSGCAARGDRGILLFVDLDNFKTLNDTQGHDVGDTFLVQVADRLRGCVDERDLVGRIGGDEFVVVIEEAGKDEAHATLRAINVANRILSALNDPFELGALYHVASASVGVVIFGEAEISPEEILKRADIAMYEAKGAGRNGMALFDPTAMDREAERYRLLNELRAAFGQNELELHFQPLVDDSGRVVGAEGLLRWRHPQRGMVYPDQFVPLAEQFGLNDNLTRYVLNCGLRALAVWQDDPRTAHLRLALNISVQSFNCDRFIDMLEQAIEAHEVDATKLTLELTEHVMAKDHAHVARRMAEVKKHGPKLSLDDFGTGYSSLAYLKSLPFDELKIDGRFVADIETGESDRALVKTILAMAHNLGLAAVAEHVENHRQEAFLRAFGCDFFQGYFYGKPMPGPEFLDFCARRADTRPVARRRLRLSTG
jgi:diguanylate cyclase (GGDEF)-like protein/PAS domain S-box-containing protein